MNWKIGDRVKLKPHPSWNQPYRGWAERGRKATVMSVFVPKGSYKEQVGVLFDRARNQKLEYFLSSDLEAE